MFIVHVHCSLFMFIVHCSHGATLIFDDVFLSASSSSSGKKNEDRIVNGYRLESGQPWYAGLGSNKDPRCFNHYFRYLVLYTTNIQGQDSCEML